MLCSSALRTWVCWQKNSDVTLASSTFSLAVTTCGVFGFWTFNSCYPRPRQNNSIPLFAFASDWKDGPAVELI